MIKINLSNRTRTLLALSGATCVVLGFLARGGVLTQYSLLKHPLVIVVGIALFALGLYSSKTGFGNGHGQGDGNDSAPGARVGRKVEGSGDEGGFGGGDA